MRFTGTNLKYVEWGLQHLLVHLNNEIVTCPEPGQFQAELKDLQAQKADVDKLLAKVDHALYKEAQ